jgi:excisionase family DNA binding protein
VAEQDKLMSVEDLAAYLDRPVATIYDWNSRGEGPPYLRLGREVRYRPRDVERWLDGRYVGREAAGRA